jgi:hypothetical protein
LLFFIWGFFHLLNENISFGNSLNAFRFQFLALLYIFFALVVYSIKSESPIISLNLFIKITLILSILISLLSLYEIYNPDIRYFLYGSAYDGFGNVLSIPGAKNVRTVSTLRNPINLGLFLIFSIILAIYGLKEANLRKLAIISIPLNTVATIFTLSRICYVLLVIILLIYFIHSTFVLGHIKIQTFLIFFFIILSVLIYFIQSDLSEELKIVLIRIDQLRSAFGNKSDPRIQNWISAINHIIDFIPFILVGTGLGMSNPASLAVNEYMIENSFITIFFELGLFGLVLFIIIIHRFFHNSIAIHKRDKNMGLFFILFLVFFLLASMTSDLHRNNPMSTYFYFLFFYSETILIKHKRYACQN